MNIKKKISFFALFLISSFFIVGEVKGYYCSEDGTRCVDSSGTSVGGQADLTPDKLSTLEEDRVHSYRITLVKQDGTKVAGPKNVTFGDKNSNFSNTNFHYNTYKFGSFNVNKPANGKIKENFISHYESSDKDYYKYIEKQIIDYVKSWDSSKKTGTNPLVNALGFNTNIDYYIEKNEYLFAIVEKNYEVAFSSPPSEKKPKSITYAVMCETADYKKIYNDLWKDLYKYEQKKAADYACDDSNSNAPIIVNAGGTAFNEVYIDRTINYYVGTGSEIAQLIEYVSNSNIVPKTNYYASDVWNLKFSRDGGSLELFGKKLMVDENGLDLNFTPLEQIAPLCSNNDLSCVYNKKYGYAYGLISITSKSTSEKCESKKDADRLNRAWDGKKCCKPGEVLNVNGKCTSSACKNEAQANNLGVSWDSKNKKCCSKGQLFNGNNCSSLIPNLNSIQTTYKFKTYAGINSCKDGGVDSTLTNFDWSKIASNNDTAMKIYSSASGNESISIKKDADKDAANYVLFNNKYLVNYGQNSLYCTEYLYTQFYGFKINFSDLFSGKFVAINNKPFLQKAISCYIEGTDKSKKETLKKYIEGLTSSSKISFSFMKNSQYNSSYEFSEPKISILGNASYSTGATIYGVEYTNVSATVQYNFTKSNISNNYINILTAKKITDNSSLKESKAYKSLEKDHIGLSTQAPTGTYQNNILINDLDGAIKNMTQSSSNSKNVNNVNSDVSTGICNFTWRIVTKTIASCNEEYQKLLKNFNQVHSVVGYFGSYINNKSLCSISVFLGKMTKGTCSGIANMNGTITTTFMPEENVTKIQFNNYGVKGNTNASCDFDIEVKDYELIFRPISLSDPFPGSNGKGRTPNSKVWDTNKIDTYIKNRQDAYTKKPLYSVTLTPSQIQKIRGYNKTYKYDDFNLKCVGSKTGTACYSSFIRTYLNTNKSVCANTNDQSEKSFNSCADYSKRQ